MNEKYILLILLKLPIQNIKVTNIFQDYYMTLNQFHKLKWLLKYKQFKLCRYWMVNQSFLRCASILLLKLGFKCQRYDNQVSLLPEIQNDKTIWRSNNTQMSKDIQYDDDDLLDLNDQQFIISDNDDHIEEQNQMNYDLEAPVQVTSSPKHPEQDDSKVAINLKGLKQLISLQHSHKQFNLMMDFVRGSGCEVIFVRQPTVEDAVKIQDDFKTEKIENSNLKNAIKLQQKMVDELKEQMQTEGMQQRSKLILFRSAQMRSNYSCYGNAIYYMELLNQNNNRSQFTERCRLANLRIGLVYGFSFEMRMVIFSVYSLYQLSHEEQLNYQHLLILGLLQLGAGNQSRHHSEVTFFAHRFIDIPRLRHLTSNYKDEAQRSETEDIVPKYNFLMDPSFAQQTDKLLNEDIPRKMQLEKILTIMLNSPLRKKFNEAQQKMHNLLQNNQMANFQVSQACTLRQFLQIFIQQAQYICLSQVNASLGACELYFRAHPDYRQNLLTAMRDQTVEYCSEIINNLSKEHEQKIIGINIILYLALGVTDRMVQQQVEEHKTIVNMNHQLLAKNPYRLMEEEIPQLRFLKHQISAVLYQYLLDQLMDCPQWEIKNQHIQNSLYQNHLQIGENEELFFQHYSSLPLRVQRIKLESFENNYYTVIRQKQRWICECAYSQRYGMPCTHELKVCLLTNSLIKDQINETCIDEQYYEKYIQDKAKFEQKINNFKRMTDFVYPLDPTTGRYELSNHRVNSRRFCRKEEA